MLIQAFDYLSYYLGSWGADILAVLFFMVIIRMGIALVFKIMKADVGYHTMQEKIKAQSRKSAVFGDKTLFKN